MSRSGHTERIFVSSAGAVRLLCECGWRSEPSRTHAEALRAYVEHLPPSDARDVAESIIAATPAHLLPRPKKETRPESESGPGLPTNTEGTRVSLHTK